MRRISPYFFELLFFALPIVFGSVGHILIVVENNILAGRFSTETVAAITIANGFMGTTFMIGLGIMMISPILARKRGEGQSLDRYLGTCILFAAFIAFLIMGVLHGAKSLMPMLGYDPTLIPIINDFVNIFGLSFFGAYIFHAMKEFLQAQEDVVFANSVALAGAGLNLILASSLTFGILGLAPLGIKGIALSGLIVRTLMPLALFLYIKRKMVIRWRFDFSFIKELLNQGLPASGAIFLEMAAFSTISLLVGRLPKEQIAAHNVVLTIATLTFLVPMSIGLATAVKVGHARGEKNYLRIKNFITSSLIMSLIFMSIPTLLFIFAAEPLTHFFTKDSAVFEIAVPLVIVAGFFQLFDGAQSTLNAILRGLEQTKACFVAMMASYWIVGIPLGIFLSFKYFVMGYWLAIIVALSVLVIILSLFLRRTLKKVRAELVQEKAL